MLSPQSQQFLLSLARNAIKTFLSTGNNIEVEEVDLPSANLTETHGTFVTLTIDGELRGCIGKIEGDDKLYQDIIDNALSAAFRDPRFPPVDLVELDQIKVEISILTVPEPIDFDGPTDLLNKIIPQEDGLILKKGPHDATFLPQVWDELSNKTDFLTHLSTKAGLSSDGWKDSDVEFLKYQVEKFAE